MTEAEAPPTSPPIDPAIEAVIAALPQEFYQEPEDVRAIDLAMIHTKGDMHKAKLAVGMEVRELKKKIKATPYLRSRWVKEVKPTTQIPNMTAPTSEQLNQNLDEATAEYQESLKTISEDDQADMGSKLFKLQMRHGLHGMAMLGGGQQRAAMQLITLMDHLRTHPYPDEFTTEGVLLRSGRRETDLMIIRAQAEYGRRATEYAQITMMTAKTQQLMHASKGGGNGRTRGKPGFDPLKNAPTQVLAQAGSTVVLNNNGDGDSK